MFQLREIPSASEAEENQEKFLTLCAHTSQDRVKWIRYIKSRLRSDEELHHIDALYVNRRVDMS